MARNRLHLLTLAAPLALASCALGPPARDAFQASGPYVGAMQTTTQIYGEMDQEILIVGVDDTGMVPSFDGEAGVGVAPFIGYRWRTRALELSYLYSDFGDPEFLGTPIDARLRSWSLDWKEYYNVESRLQPYLFLGLSELDLELDDAAVSLIGPETADVKLEGTAIDVGGGASYHVTPNLSIFGQLTWQFAEYNQATTVFPPDDLQGEIDGDALNLSFGASWTF